MAMNRTEGYYKAFIEVHYLNNQGDKQHMMSFQLCTIPAAAPDSLEKCYAKVKECEADFTKVQDYIRAAIKVAEDADYNPIVSFHVMC